MRQNLLYECKGENLSKTKEKIKEKLKNLKLKMYVSVKALKHSQVKTHNYINICGEECFETAQALIYLKK